MPGRTYLPTLRRLLHQVSVYTTAHQARLEDVMTSSQLTAFTAFITALQDLVTELGPEPMQN